MSTTALRLLLGPQAAEVLHAAIAEYGAQLNSLQVVDVHVQPTGGARVRYYGDVRRSDGRSSREVLIATTGEQIPRGATVVAGEFAGIPVEVGVWRWPQDPALPGLRVACDPARLVPLLAGAGLAAAPTPRITVRAYRPAQRAVLQADVGYTTYFVKVVRPVVVSELKARHRMLSNDLPVPPVLAATDTGVIVLPAAPGTPMRDVVAATSTPALPTPAALEDLLDRLPADVLALPGRRTHLQRVHHSARVLRDTAGEVIGGGDIDVVMAALLESPPEPTRPVPVHGDFYEGQLLITGSRVTGLLDVDTAGPGDRADEWATLIGHLSVLGLNYPRARSYCDAVLEHARLRIAPRELHQRVAAVILGLATGPFRAQQPDWPPQTAARIGLARHWTDLMRDRSSSAPARLMSARDGDGAGPRTPTA